MDVQGTHSKHQGLLRYGLAMKEILLTAQRGKDTGNHGWFLPIIESAKKELADLISLESELARLEQDSPCLKCKKIKKAVADA